MSLVGASVNTNVTNTNNVSNQTQIDNQTTIQESEIYNEISNAYDSSIEVISKVRNEINAANDAIAKANSVQTNTAGGIKLSGLKNSKISLSQANKGLLNVSLVASVKAINDLQVNDKQKAIVADMVGLTQSAGNQQDSKNDSKKDASTLQDTQNTNKQEGFATSVVSGRRNTIRFNTVADFPVREGFNLLHEALFKEGALFGANVNTNVNNVSNESNSWQETNNLTMEKTKESQIQNYMTTIKEKQENLQEFAKNLKNNIEAAGNLAQSNDFGGIEITDSEGLEFDFKQSNDVAITLTNEFSDFIQDAAKVLKETETGTDKKMETGQAATNLQTGANTSEQTTETKQVTKNENSQVGTSTGIIVMVIVLAVIAAIGGLVYMSMTKGSGAGASAFYTGGDSWFACP